MEEKINMNEVVKVVASIYNSFQDAENNAEKLFPFCDSSDRDYYATKFEDALTTVKNALSELSEAILVQAIVEAECDASTSK